MRASDSVSISAAGALPGRGMREALSGMRGAVREGVALAPLTHLRIGGPADWFVEPFGEEDVAIVVRACRELGVPLYLLGGGSNLVVADEGVRGVVMQLGSLNRIVREQDRVTVGAGVSLASLLRATKTAGLAGLEVLTGIPAQVGGAVAMNAGTRDGETFDRLVSVTVVEPDGRIAVRGKDQLAPRYRDGGLGPAVVVQATFELVPDDPEAIFARFSASLQARNATQPVSQRSVGCVFRNPPGDKAGRLIEAAGCKTMQRGGLSVSSRHANYLVNDDTGCAADFRALMLEVRQQVLQQFGVELEPEVKFWGLADPDLPPGCLDFGRS